MYVDVYEKKETIQNRINVDEVKTPVVHTTFDIDKLYFSHFTFGLTLKNHSIISFEWETYVRICSSYKE